MSPVLEFECRRAVGGYQVVPFDERKFAGATVNFDGSVVPAADMTEDERAALNRWGVLLEPVPRQRPRVCYLLEPQSQVTEGFDLFASKPGLFLDFASTQITVEAVKSFADRTGLLGIGNYPETVEGWYSAIRSMKQAVGEWDKAKTTGDFTRVMRVIKGRGGDRSLLDDKGAGIDANILLRKDVQRSVPRLCIRPFNLLDALWTQFTLAIDGRQNFRPCAECRTWFQTETAGGRSDKEYCSDACRQRAYRKRKKGGA
jgi:hypothetical protein